MGVTETIILSCVVVMLTMKEEKLAITLPIATAMELIKGTLIIVTTKMPTRVTTIIEMKTTWMEATTRNTVTTRVRNPRTIMNVRDHPTIFNSNILCMLIRPMTRTFSQKRGQ